MNIFSKSFSIYDDVLIILLSGDTSGKVKIIILTDHGMCILIKPSGSYVGGY